MIENSNVKIHHQKEQLNDKYIQSAKEKDFKPLPNMIPIQTSLNNLPFEKIKIIKLNYIQGGAQGSVFRVYAYERRMFMVAKIFSKSKLNLENNLKQEVDVIKKLFNLDPASKSMFLEVHSMTQDDTTGNIQLLMELGMSDLDDYITYRRESGKTFSYQELEYIAYSLAKASFILQSQGIYHRDIKPKNIILTTDEKIKLADFSLSINYSNKNTTAKVYPVGTPHFMLPEIVKDMKNKKFSTYCLFANDLYAIGKSLEFIPINEEDESERVKKMDLVAMFCDAKNSKELIYNFLNDKIINAPEGWMSDKAEFEKYMNRQYYKKMTDDQLLLAIQQMQQFFLLQDCIDLIDLALEFREGPVLDKLDQIKPRGEETSRHLAMYKRKNSTAMNEEIPQSIAKEDIEKFVNDLMILSQLYIQKGLCYEARNESIVALELQMMGLEMKFELLCLQPDFKFPKNRNGCLSQSFNNMANLYIKLNDLDKAEEYYEKAIENKISKLSKAEQGSDYSLPKYYNNLGMLQSKRDKLKEAEDNIRNSLKLRIDMKAANPDIAASNASLGTLLSKQGKFDESLDKLSKALELKKQAFGNIHPEIARTLTNIGIVLKELKKPEDAQNHFKEAIEIYLKVFGESHIETIQAKKLLILDIENS